MRHGNSTFVFGVYFNRTSARKGTDDLDRETGVDSRGEEIAVGWSSRLACDSKKLGANNAQRCWYGS